MPIEPPPDHGSVLDGARALLIRARAAVAAAPHDERLALAVVSLAGAVAALELPAPPTKPPAT